MNFDSRNCRNIIISLERDIKEKAKSFQKEARQWCAQLSMVDMAFDNSLRISSSEVDSNWREIIEKLPELNTTHKELRKYIKFVWENGHYDSERPGRAIPWKEILADAKINKSVSRLRGICKEETLFTLGQLMQRVIIEHTKHDLMSNPSKPISDIADDRGFNDVSAFSKIFKRITGQSPKEFRRCSP